MCIFIWLGFIILALYFYFDRRREAREEERKNPALDALRLPAVNGFARVEYPVRATTAGRPRDFIAVDVETANEQAFSICAIGIVEVRDGVIVATDFDYVRPMEEYFAAKNTEINGITWEMVKDAPTFRELWEEKLAAKFVGNVLVAHYAPFDISCILYTLRAAGVVEPSLRYVDTLAVAREFFRLPRNRLVDVAAHLGISTAQHHNADYDAYVAAQILLTALADPNYMPQIQEL